MSNKNDALWMSNCNAVKKYLFLNKKMPLKGVKNPETGTELKSWYYNQMRAYAESRLEEGRVKILTDTFGSDWNKGPSVVTKLYTQNLSLDTAYSEVKDKGYNVSVITMYNRGVINKKQALFYLERGVSCLFDVYKENPDLCTTENICKCVTSLPGIEWCRVFCFVRNKKLIVALMDGEIKEIKYVMDMYKTVGKEILSKKGFSELFNLYVVKNMSISDVARSFGRSTEIIRQKCSKMYHLLDSSYACYIQNKYGKQLSGNISVRQMGFSSRALGVCLTAGFETLEDFIPYCKDVSSKIELSLNLADKLKGINMAGRKTIFEIADVVWKFNKKGAL